MVLALAAAMSMGTVVSAYADPGIPAGTSGVVVAGQGSSRQEHANSGPGVQGGPGALAVQPSAPAEPVAIAPEVGTAPADEAVSAPVDVEAPAVETGSETLDFYPAGPSGIAGIAAEGVLMAKTDGVNQQITNISLKLNGVEGAISYGVYVNHGGYLPWKGDGLAAGGTEDSTYVEAIQVALSGEAAKRYNVYYRGTSAYAGQHGWACNEELMGTVDRGDYLTSIEVCLVPKEMGAPGSYERRFFSNHSEYINIMEGNTTYYVNGVGYTG